MKIKKLFLVLGVILFSLVISGCTLNSFEIEEGIYICNSYDYYGELELKKISENEFVNSNGLNVFKVNYDGEYEYYLINVYVTPVNQDKKIYLDFHNLETEEMHKITFKKYYFVDEDNNMIDPNKDFISITYTIDNINFAKSFYKKNNIDK